jgi:hypothetical protein
MIEWQAFFTTLVIEMAHKLEKTATERQLILWSLGRMANQTFHGIRHAFLDSVFPTVAAGIRCLLEIIATIDFILESDDNLEQFVDIDAKPPVRVPFQRMLREAGEREGRPWRELYVEYSENTHPKMSILKTAWRESPNDSYQLGVAIDDEWHPEDFKLHWDTTKLCLDRIATALVGCFALDPVLLKRLDQLVREHHVFESVAE